MTDARIARAYPDLSENQALLALLGEMMNMARDVKLRQLEIAEESDPKAVEEFISQVGREDEIMSAEQTRTATVLYILENVNEQDLLDGHDNGLLTDEDYREALTAKRKMMLERNHTPKQDRDLER